ncbi:VOC family protein [Anaerotignum sp.]
MKMKHVTINTAKMEESIQFYQDIIGLEMQRDLRPMGSSIVFLADGDDPCIELIERPEQAYSGAGISIGFHVADVEAKRAELEEKGFAPTPIISPNPNTKFFFIKDPSGVTIQFI